jgi:hypothetical protein
MIIPLAEQWLQEVLAGDTGLVALLPKYPGANPSIYGYVAPDNAPYPVVIYSYHSGSDVYGSGTARIMSHLVYQVKAVGEGASFSTLGPIADRIDELLHGALGGVTGLSVLSCIREAPVAYAEIENGIQYRHLGGLYRLQVRPEEA